MKRKQLKHRLDQVIAKLELARFLIGARNKHDVDYQLVWRLIIETIERLAK